jgi:hypothetical protein
VKAYIEALNRAQASLSRKKEQATIGMEVSA